MNWEQLLSLKKFGDKNKRLRSEENPIRPGFDVDYDRIVFSTPFRLLQDKTQVIPFSKTHFVHTRLTHSLEVSVVARSLGRMAGEGVLAKHPALARVHGFSAQDFGSICAAAALAHDIGNPPFGHSGEKAIGYFFSNGKGARFQELLNAAQWKDLTHFEGNANGFRILNRHQEKQGGLRLSYATLGAFMKYPKASLPHRPSAHIADKKYGYFQSEKMFFDEICSDLGLAPLGKGTHARHPLVYLVEAADDICYTLIDFEDGINLGLIPEEYALEYLIKVVSGKLNIDKYRKMKSLTERIAYLRAISISVLIEEAVDIFLKHEKEILEGSFSSALMDKSAYQAQLKDVIGISVTRVYRSKEVLEKELTGFQTIQCLLEILTDTAERIMMGKDGYFDRLLQQNIPEIDFDSSKDNAYEQLLNICGFIAQLTDSQAVELSKKWKA